MLALRPRGDDADIVVRRDSEVWISSVAGELRRALPVETIAALLLPGGVVYATSNAVVVDDRKQIDVQGVEALYELDATHAVAGLAGATRAAMGFACGENAIYSSAAGSLLSQIHMASELPVPTNRPQNPPAGVARFQSIPRMTVPNNGAIKVANNACT